MAIIIKSRGIETPKIKPKFVEVDEEAVIPFTVVVAPIIGEPPTKTPATAVVAIPWFTAIACASVSTEAVPWTIVEPGAKPEIIKFLKSKLG